MSEHVRLWGGTHPDEKAATALADDLKARPIPNVIPGIANPLAREQGKRYVDINLAGSFPGDSSSKKYEQRRAVQVLAESQGFDVVIDLHNINSGRGENHACIDTSTGLSPRALGFLRTIGVRHLVVTDYAGIHKFVPNSFVLETLTNGLGSDVERLRSALDRLANDLSLPTANEEDFSWYRHLGSPHVSTVPPGTVTPDLNAFDVLPGEIATMMGYPDRQVCFSGWLDEPNEKGYWGEICEPIV